MEYLVKYTFSTAKISGKNAIHGRMGNAETEITTELNLLELQTEYVPEVKAACYNSIKDMAKVVKIGKIIDINIESIIPK